MSCLRLSLMRARRRFSNRGFRLCGRAHTRGYAGHRLRPQSQAPGPRFPVSGPRSPAPTLRSSAGSPALRGNPMLDGQAAPTRVRHVSDLRPPRSGAESETRLLGALPEPAPVESASPARGFKEAASASPPRPSAPRPAESGRLRVPPPAFVPARGVGRRGREWGVGLAPVLRVPPAAGSRARGAQTPASAGRVGGHRRDQARPRWGFHPSTSSTAPTFGSV